MDTELSERVRGRELRRARQMDIEGAKGQPINDVRAGRAPKAESRGCMSVTVTKGGEGVPNSKDFADVMNGWPQMDVSCEGKLRKDME